MGPAPESLRRHRDPTSGEDLKAYVKEHLARYKVPREIEPIDELPRNQTGKVLKRELRESEDGGEK